MSETECLKKLKPLLEAAGALCFKVHGHAMQRKGWPDLQVYSKIWTGLLELKWQGNKLSPLQLDKIEELKARNTNVFVLRFLDIAHRARIEDEQNIILQEVDNWTMWPGEAWLDWFQKLSGGVEI